VSEGWTNWSGGRNVHDNEEKAMMSTTPGAPSTTRDHLALALDVDDLVEALRLAHQLKEWFGVAKVGLELFSAVGPDAVTSLVEEGYRVFLDLKLADIPTTVNKASRVIGALGASYLTMHTFVGPEVVAAGVEGLGDGAAAAGLAVPTVLGVTILTSDAGAPPHILPKRVNVARQAGCGGVICAAADVAQVKAIDPSLLAVVPGIRPASSETHDQARAATPAGAVAAGADILVIGRAVTAAPDRPAAAAALAASVAWPPA
jgi:orotidine-5'-phosphate decarboxylase